MLLRKSRESAANQARLQRRLSSPTVVNYKCDSAPCVQPLLDETFFYISISVNLWDNVHLQH